MPFKMKLQPLYRRGPDLAHPIRSTQWPAQYSYGPPDDVFLAVRSFRREFDSRLFSLYFLVAETLATYLAYRIAQHCLQGCRVKFLSPGVRLWIGCCYCALKITLIDYAFHGSAYFALSLLIMIVYFFYAFKALSFHSGPLQFLFFDCAGRKNTKATPSVMDRVLSVGRRVANAVRYIMLQQLVEVPRVDGRYATQLVASSTNMMTGPQVASKHSRVQLFFGHSVEVDVDVWNRTVTNQWFHPLLCAAKYQCARVPTTVQNQMEARFIILIRHDGLILAFYLVQPSATLFAQLNSPYATPFEIVARLINEPSDTPFQLYFMYAEAPTLTGHRSSTSDRRTLLHLLRQLNQKCNINVDVPLRALRAPNFIAAGVGRITKKEKRSVTALDEVFG